MIHSFYFQLAWAHQTLASVNASNWVGSLGSRVVAEILLLVCAKVCVSPVAAFDILDSLKESGARNIHLSQDGVVEARPIELGHFYIGEAHVCILKVGPVDGRIKEGRTNQIRSLEIAIPYDTLLKGYSFQILSTEIRSIEVDTTGNGDGAAALKSGSTTGRDFGIYSGAGPITHTGPSRLIERQSCKNDG